MKLKAIYEDAVRNGLRKDPRTKKELKNELARIRKEYGKLDREDKRYFDKDALKHPFSDTRILYGDKNTDIRTIMTGIDIGGEELLMTYILNEKGAGIDLVMSHHPSGRALIELHNVMYVQADILHGLGLDIDIARSLIKERAEQVARKCLPANSQRTVDIARLLDIPLMCVHTPADNHVVDFLKNLLAKKKPKKVKDILGILKTVPEYRDAMTKGTGPRLIAGKETNKTGRIFVDMTGGTEGSKKVFARLSQAGVGTVIAMHLGEEHFKAAKEELMNVVIAGHIASDNLGLNLLLDALAKKHSFNVIPCSGFFRVKR